MDNCPSLKDKRVCSTLSEMQGWVCAVDEETCKACGGPSDTTYLTVLGKRLDSVALRRTSLPIQVSEALSKRYPDKADSLLNNEDYKAKKGWEGVKETWAKAESFGRSLLSRSLGDRRVSLEQLQVRNVSCHGQTLEGAVVGPACSNRRLSEDGVSHYCGACGCGDKKIARLDGEGYTKLHYPYLECPIGREGFSNGQPRHLKFGCQGGIGDLCIHMWMAEGLKAIGGGASFACPSPKQRELLELFGQQIDEDPSGSIETGGHAKHYQYEVKIDKGANPRSIVWSAVLGGVPLQRPKIVVPAEALSEAKSLYGGQTPLVLLFPKAEWKPREWPLSYWMDLYWGLRKRGLEVRVLGGHQEDVKDWGKDALWGFSWGTVASLIGQAQLVVGNDSGPAHLAGTLGTNTVALMGPTSNIFTHYQTVREAALSKAELACTGCHFDGARGFRQACDLQCESLMTLKPRSILDLCSQALAEPLVPSDSWRLPETDASPRNQS